MFITPSEEQNENLFSFCPSDGGTKGLIPFTVIRGFIVVLRRKKRRANKQV